MIKRFEIGNRVKHVNSSFFIGKIIAAQSDFFIVEGGNGTISKFNGYDLELCKDELETDLQNELELKFNQVLFLLKEINDVADKSEELRNQINEFFGRSKMRELIDEANSLAYWASSSANC